MKCSQCGSDAATGAGTCPGCGTAIPTAAEAATLTQAGPAMAFHFDAAHWTTADRMAGGATLVLFISLFLPWFSVSAGFGSFTESSSVDALTAHGYLYLVLLVALAMLGYLVVSAALDSQPAQPLSHEQILGAAAGLNLLLVLIGVLIMPGGSSSLVKAAGTPARSSGWPRRSWLSSHWPPRCAGPASCTCPPTSSSTAVAAATARRTSRVRSTPTAGRRQKPRNACVPPRRRRRSPGRR